MAAVAEIYCYSDSEHRSRVHSMLAGLRDRGHRVVVGSNLAELALLLEVNRPTVVLYALSSGTGGGLASFQSFLEKINELSLPLIVLDPEAPAADLTMHLSSASGHTVRKLAAAALTMTVEGLAEAVSAAQSARAARHNGIAEFLNGGDDSIHPLKVGLRDTIGEGRAAVEIETVVKATDVARIITSVHRNDVVIVREEQVAERTDPNLEVKMETQHLEAVRTYAPVQSSRIKPLGNKSTTEVSGPITTPGRTSSNSFIISDGWYGRLPLIIALMFLGLIITSVAALLLAINGEPEPPRPVERPAAPKVTQLE